MNPNSLDLTNFSEWTEWHLTPRGWERGSTKDASSISMTDVAIPRDRVITCIYYESVNVNSIWIQKRVSEVWRNSDVNLVTAMLDKFGNCPESM
ncbi:hypothetical protein [Calothrix sp. 336/3]|uniref:hypothetical protein n=1 Tax=Calothrix sp. 336/3 TaxID=1337936 RepID=UPI0004E31A0D|nr:hypothetical protein [Calothrix sp. 336/3]